MRARPNGSLALTCPYDPGLTTALKSAVPATGRRWQPDEKVWLIDSQYGIVVADLVRTFLNVELQPPKAQKTAITETRILEMRYLGATKNRGDGQPSAFAYVNGDWSAIFPETVLLDWFSAVPPSPGEMTTLYGVLGIAKTVMAGDIKTAYRRLAKQWHPDICREPNADEVFKRIGEAYRILSDDLTRRKYDAGLQLTASMSTGQRGYENLSTYGYRSPLRCGYVLAEGIFSLGRFLVSKILAWEDIVDAAGHILTTSWPPGADHFVEVWT